MSISFDDMEARAVKGLMSRGWEYDNERDQWVSAVEGDFDISHIVLDLFSVYFDLLSDELVGVSDEAETRDDLAWHFVKMSIGDDEDIDLSLIRKSIEDANKER